MVRDYEFVLNVAGNNSYVKPYFHYGCALRCVALRGERNRNIIICVSYISRHATPRNAMGSRKGNKSLAMELQQTTTALGCDVYD